MGGQDDDDADLGSVLPRWHRCSEGMEGPATAQAEPGAAAGGNPAAGVTPVSDLERTVYAAMILAGRPVPTPSWRVYERVGRRGEPQDEAARRRAPQGAHRTRGENQPTAPAMKLRSLSLIHI